MYINFEEIEAIAKDLHSKFEYLPKQIEVLQTEESLCDQEISDLLHIIELSAFNASEGYKYSRELQITLQKRREIKNEVTSLRQLKQSLESVNGMKEKLTTLNQKIGERNKIVLSKKYTPRVRSDLIERFNKCNINKLL